jgi:hypothetical protein
VTELKNRGVADTFYLACDGLKRIPNSVNTVFAATIEQTCGAPDPQHVQVLLEAARGQDCPRPDAGIRGVNAGAAETAFEALDEK